MFNNKLAKAISDLACSVDGLRETLCAHAGDGQSQETQIILKRMEEMENKIMATQAELTADLKSVTAQLKKLDGDTKALQTSVDTANAKIVELEALVAAGGTIGQELIDAVAEVKAAVQVVDDNVPEVPTPPAA